MQLTLGPFAKRSREPTCGLCQQRRAIEQQSCLMLHRTRHLFIRQQTAVINAIRAHLAEFGIVAPVGRRGVEELLDVVADADNQRLPELARGCLAALGAQLRMKRDSIYKAWPRKHDLLEQIRARTVNIMMKRYRVRFSQCGLPLLELLWGGRAHGPGTEDDLALLGAHGGRLQPPLRRRATPVGLGGLQDHMPLGICSNPLYSET